MALSPRATIWTSPLTTVGPSENADTNAAPAMTERRRRNGIETPTLPLQGFSQPTSALWPSVSAISTKLRVAYCFRRIQRCCMRAASKMGQNPNGASGLAIPVAANADGPREHSVGPTRPIYLGARLRYTASCSGLRKTSCVERKRKTGLRDEVYLRSAVCRSRKNRPQDP
jgi:hypothetical protein